MSNLKELKKRWTWSKRPLRWGADSQLPQRVAYSITKDDQGFVVHFRGMAQDTLLKIFDFLVPDNGNGVAKSFDAFREHDAVYLNGHGYHRLAVRLNDRNERFCSDNSLCELIESRFRSLAKHGSFIQRFDHDEFMNLSKTKQ